MTAKAVVAAWLLVACCFAVSCWLGIAVSLLVEFAFLPVLFGVTWFAMSCTYKCSRSRR